MATDFSGVADDFFVNLSLQTALPLPTGRETVLHFFEAAQKEFRSLTSFFQRESGEYVLEGDRESGTYQWVELHPKRLAAGYFNPPSLEAAYRMHRWLLDRSLYFLGVSGLDVESLDVLFGFNLDYQGNRDAIVCEAMLAASPLGALAADLGPTCVECEPTLVVSLDEECYRQARISLETRGSSYQVRTGQYDEEPISAYLTVRQYPRPGQVLEFKEIFPALCEVGEDLTSRLVVAQILRPIAAAIASAR